MKPSEEDIAQILSSYGQSIQPTDRRRKRNPSPAILAARTRYARRQVQRAVWEAEAGHEAAVMAAAAEDRAVAEAVKEIQEKWVENERD